MAAIKRRRANTYADEITVTNELGVVINITGYTFAMHVTTDKAPDALGTNLLYTVPGDILDALTGRVEFAPTALQATQADGTYYYEVVMTDGATRTRTIALDKYVYY